VLFIRTKCVPNLVWIFGGRVLPGCVQGLGFVRGNGPWLLMRPWLVAASRLGRMVRSRAWSSLVQNRLLATASSLYRISSAP